MNKARRTELTQLKYEKRIRRWVASLSMYICQDGSSIQNPKAVDVIRDRGQLLYKAQSTPCSCWMCSGYYKYNRNDKRNEDRRLLNEYYEDLE
jgi:hypothetical protein